MQWGLVHLGKPAPRSGTGDLLLLSSGESSVPLFCHGLQEVDLFSLAPWYEGLCIPFTRWLWPGEWGVVVYSLLPRRGSMAKTLPFALVQRMSAGPRDGCRVFQKSFGHVLKLFPPTWSHIYILKLLVDV